MTLWEKLFRRRSDRIANIFRIVLVLVFVVGVIGRLRGWW